MRRRVPPEIFSPIHDRRTSACSRTTYLGSLANSVIITVSTTVATLVFGVPAGYAFARGQFSAGDSSAGWLLFSRMVPPVIFIIPLFLFFHQLDLIDSFPG